MVFVWALIIAVLQVTVLDDINLLVILAVFAGLKKGPLAGLLAGGVIGVLAGVFSSAPFTLNLALYMITGFMTGLVRSRMFYRETVFSECVFSFAGVIFFYSVFFILTGTPQPFIFYTAFFSAALSPLVFKVVEG
ncbi:MAG: hypothetical protein KKC66_05580 [Candidatus Omnitrophica bacterium]|nr:hypothetical protein [Candidatus Omnitrophota bacterium]MBU1933352.1 hypothetical protein [Candidatus Omnitrophota bacterium]